MNQISIFENTCPEHERAIFIHGVAPEIRDIILHLGKPTGIAKKLGTKYTKLKEWPTGRKPISLNELTRLLDFCQTEFKETMMTKINQREILISTKYSPHKIKLPKNTSNDLSYAIGLILGDGYIAGDSLNARGNWTISVYFDNNEHREIYNNVIKNEFGLICKNIPHKPNCPQSFICSRALHYIFRHYYKMHNGYKANIIEIPQRILYSEKERLPDLIQGLFDSDGTITKGDIKYSTVSKKMAEQVQQELQKMKITSVITIWIKAKKYKPLYTVLIKSKSRGLFAKKIGFRHPLKKLALDKLLDSPLV